MAASTWLLCGWRLTLRLSKLAPLTGRAQVIPRAKGPPELQLPADFDHCRGAAMLSPQLQHSLLAAVPNSVALSVKRHCTVGTTAWTPQPCNP